MHTQRLQTRLPRNAWRRAQTNLISGAGTRWYGSTVERLDMRDPGAVARFREHEEARRPCVLLGLTDEWRADRWHSFACLAADLGGAARLYCKERGVRTALNEFMRMSASEAANAYLFEFLGHDGEDASGAAGLAGEAETRARILSAYDVPPIFGAENDLYASEHASIPIPLAANEHRRMPIPHSH